MFYGMSVHKICKRAKTYDYRILSYQADEYKNKEIKLECRVLDVYDEIEQKKDKKQKEEDEIIKNRILEVEDDRGNQYILSYKLGKRKYDTVYMPIFEKEDNLNTRIILMYMKTVKYVCREPLQVYMRRRKSGYTFLLIQTVIVTEKKNAIYVRSKMMRMS